MHNTYIHQDRINYLGGHTNVRHNTYIHQDRINYLGGAYQRKAGTLFSYK